MAIKNKFVTQSNNQDYGHKNYIINGDFSVWQRGTSFGPGVYGADRWRGAGAAGEAVIRSTDSPSGQGYCLEIAKTSGAQWILHYIEANDARRIAGKTVTVSFWIKRTAGNETIGLQVGYANSVDNFTATTNIYAGPAYTPSGNWKQYSATFALPSGAANGIVISITTAGSNNGAGTMRIADVQLELGSFVTSFERRPFALELSMCQRYYEKTFFYGITPASAAGLTTGELIICGNGTGYGVFLTWFFKVTKRINPTVVTYNPSVAGSNAQNTSTNQTVQNISATPYDSAIDIQLWGTNSDSGNHLRVHATASSEF